MSKYYKMIVTEINEETGTIISDNKRIDRIITDNETKQTVTDLFMRAKTFVDNI